MYYNPAQDPNYVDPYAKKDTSHKGYNTAADWRDGVRANADQWNVPANVAKGIMERGQDGPQAGQTYQYYDEYSGTRKNYVAPGGQNPQGMEPMQAYDQTQKNQYQQSSPIKQPPGKGGMLGASASGYTGPSFAGSQQVGQVSPVKGNPYSTGPPQASTGIQNPEDRRGQYPTHQPPQGGGMGANLGTQSPGSMSGTQGPQLGGPMAPPQGDGRYHVQFGPDGRPIFPDYNPNAQYGPQWGGPNGMGIGPQPPQGGVQPYRPSGRSIPGSNYQPLNQAQSPGYYPGGY